MPFLLGLATITTIETAKGIGRGINGTFWATCDGIKEGAILGYHHLEKSARTQFYTKFKDSSNPVKGAIFLTMAFVPFLLGLAAVTMKQGLYAIYNIARFFPNGLHFGARLGYQINNKTKPFWQEKFNEIRDEHGVASP